MEKIAIITDSGSDVTSSLQHSLQIEALPLRIIIDGKEYTDGVDITGPELYASLKESSVSTSLPIGSDIIACLDRLVEQGYTHAIAILISSGLSGTYNTTQLVAESYEGLQLHVIDTLNISLGSGFTALKAAEYVKQGLSYDTIIAKLKDDVFKSKVFFTLETLEYLRRGGRIGLVAGSVASVLSIKPIMSCNEEGVYHTVSKVRTYRKSILKMIDIAKDYAKDAKACRVVLLHPQSDLKLDELISIIKEKITNCVSVEISRISPSLGVHTGPEAIGIAVNLID